MVLQLRLVSWDGDALRIPATAYAQALVVIGERFYENQKLIR